MRYSVKWSTGSLILYIVSGLICGICCYYAKRRELRTRTARKLILREYFPLYFTWIVLAVFRYVDGSVGGTDALGYINNFTNSLHPYGMENTDILFKLFNQAIRLISGDYHVFFFVFYLIEIISFVFFINEFSRPESSSIPITILFYLYLRSFTSIRSNFAISILLIALVFLNKKKNIKAFVLAISSVFIHVSAFVYALFILFYFIYINKKIGLFKSILIFSAAFLVGTIVQTTLMSGSISYLSSVGSGAYGSYASKSLQKNFLTDYSVSNLPQLALFITLLCFRKKIDGAIEVASDKDRSKIYMLRLICYFDFFMVPIIFILGIYRGYEYFYLARLVMWGEIIPIIRRYFLKQSGIFISFLFLLFFIVWMYGRIEATYESSQLMPYVFGLFTR